MIYLVVLFLATAVLYGLIARFFFGLRREMVFEVMALAYLATAVAWAMVGLASVARILFAVDIVPREILGPIFVVVPFLSALAKVGALYFGNGNRRK